MVECACSFTEINMGSWKGGVNKGGRNYWVMSFGGDNEKDVRKVNVKQGREVIHKEVV